MNVLLFSLDRCRLLLQYQLGRYTGYKLNSFKFKSIKFIIILHSGMSNSSFVWHNNSRVFFRRHYHGRIRPVSYFDNLDKLFEESDERSREETVDEMPQYLQKRTTSFGKRWVMMKAKRKFFMRPTKKKTTKYMFWAVTKQKSTRIMDTTIDRKVLAKQYRVW